MEVIVGHVNADFDSLAAMVAARKIYPKAELVFTGTQNKNVSEFVSLHKDYLQFLDLRQLDENKIDCLIVVDTKIAERLGELEDVVYLPGVKIYTYDHHPATKDDMKLTRDFSELTGATTTTLVKIIREKGIRLSPFDATLFVLGIHEDTGSLTYPTTTYDDACAVAYLMGVGVSLEVLNRFLNQPLTLEQRQLLKRLFTSAQVIDLGGVSVLLASSEVEDYVEGAAVLTHKMEDLENAEVVFTLLKTKNRIHIIGRSRAEQVHVGDVLAMFDGGGHPQAASAVAKETSLRKVKEKLIAELKRQVRKPLLASDLMSKDIQTVCIRESLVQAETRMKQMHLTGMPVVERGRLLGLISKQDIKKARYHKLIHAPVKGFMSRKIATVSPQATSEEILQLFFKEDVDSIPVVEESKLVGIVTRASTLRALYGANYLVTLKLASLEEKFKTSEVLEKIKTSFPREIQLLLKTLGRLAEKLEMRAYLVGGVVRDLLLGQPNLDIDIVVEGDGITFGKEVVKKLGGRISAHKKFGTAVVTLSDGFHVDVASARVEKYKRPAALPEVKPSSIQQDLYRRDFSVNAMAVFLNPPRFGALLDFFGGQSDIKEGCVRVLHGKSFIEDPTRIFRAVRFEQRYGFKMDKDTERLAREAVRKKMVGRLTSVRIRDELVLILSEGTAWNALNRLSELGVIEYLQPKVKVNAKLQNSFRQVDLSCPQLNFYFKAECHRWLVYLMLLLSNLGEEELISWCRKMKIKKADTEVLRMAVVELPRVAKSLSSSTKIKNSKLYFLLKDLLLEALVFVFAQGQALTRRRINFYLAGLKDTKLAITGKDIIKLGIKPSPEFSRMLDDCLRAKLDGVVKSKSQELEFIRDRVEKLRIKKGTKS